MVYFEAIDTWRRKNPVMNKLILVYNPRSAQHNLIEEEVLTEVRGLSGWMVAKFEVKSLSVTENVKRLVKLISDGDFVVAAGGDGTATMALNGVIKSGKEVAFSALGYGHFSDFARTLGAMRGVEGVAGLVRKFQADEVRKYYPLEVLIDGEHWRYATCYVTMGMAAEATEIFDQKAVRERIQQTSHTRSYFRMAKWYYKNRKKREFVPGLKLNGKELTRVTDVIALNAPFMARVMRGDKWYEQAESFAAGGFWLKRSWTLFRFMMKSMLAEVKRLKIEFEKPAQFMIQADGEYAELKGVEKIEIKKGPMVLVV